MYSRYGDPTSVVQDIESNAQSVCRDNLKSEYFLRTEIHLFLALIVLLPIIVMVILAVVIRSTHQYIHTELTKSSTYHPMFAGVTITGVYTLLFVLCIDLAAVIFYAKQNHEYSEDEVHGNFNLFIVCITMGMDIVVALQFLYCMLYLCCSQMHKHCEFEKDGERHKCCKCCCECCLPFTLAPYFYVIFGNKKQIGRWKLQDQPNADNKLNLWVLTGTMVAPLFCIASHAGYILIAWVTEPAKSTAAFFVGLGSFLYLFIVFKQCYVAHKDAELEELRQQQGQEDEQNSDCSTLLSYWGSIQCCSCQEKSCLCPSELCYYPKLKKCYIFCCKKHWVMWFFPIITIPLYSLYTLCINSCIYTGLCCSVSIEPSQPKDALCTCCSICKNFADDETLEKYWESVEVSDYAIVKTNENIFSMKSFCTCSLQLGVAYCRKFSIFHFCLLCPPSANNTTSPVS